MCTVEQSVTLAEYLYNKDIESDIDIYAIKKFVLMSRYLLDELFLCDVVLSEK